MTGKIFDIQRFCTNDGPGIRTVVFFKGCSLSCAWCHNPESKQTENEILYNEKSCIQCTLCEAVCPEHQHSFDSAGHIFSRDNCNLCMKCVDACPSGALKACGEEKSADDIVEATLRDRQFYEQSGGGVTLSGGEPLMQFEFALELLKKLKKNGIHTLFLPSENSLDKNLEEKIFVEAEYNKVRVVLIPNIIQEEFVKYDIGYIETQPLLTPTKFPLEYYTNSVLKRLFDILFSLAFLIIIGSWLFPIIAIIIKSTSKGNVFFKQKRYGYHDEVFECIKFRTMVENEESSTKTTSKDDYRITKFGKFLRKTSLDETPQFINVFLKIKD